MKKKGLHNHSVVVVGAGASGLMAAITAARQGAHVWLVEQKEKAGKKIYATGNGRCNFTNKKMDLSCYHENTFAMSVIGQFDKDRTLSFFRELGIFPYEKDGYYYPASEQASSVVKLMVQEAERLGVIILLNTKVERIQPENTELGTIFQISMTTMIRNDMEKMVKKNGKKKSAVSEIKYENKKKKASVNKIYYETRRLIADKVILACGGKASPALGSDGSGYELAGIFGHRVVQPLPALTGIRCGESWFRELAGVRISAKVTILADGKPLASDQGELQLTDYGISGIPVFQVSRYAAKAMAEGKNVQAELSFFPEIPGEELEEYLKSHSPEQYGGLYPEKLLAVLKRLSAFSTGLRCHCVEMNGFDRAQVTCGGVALEEVDQGTLESLLCPGLHFAGELLDVDGICGGYNLQWAWSSGWLAGKSAAQDKDLTGKSCGKSEKRDKEV